MPHVAHPKPFRLRNVRPQVAPPAVEAAKEVPCEPAAPDHVPTGILPAVERPVRLEELVRHPRLLKLLGADGADVGAVVTAARHPGLALLAGVAWRPMGKLFYDLRVYESAFPVSGRLAISVCQTDTPGRSRICYLFNRLYRDVLSGFPPDFPPIPRNRGFDLPSQCLCKAFENGRLEGHVHKHCICRRAAMRRVCSD